MVCKLKIREETKTKKILTASILGGLIKVNSMSFVAETRNPFGFVYDNAITDNVSGKVISIR